MTSSHTAKDVNLGSIGASPIVDFWNNLLEAISSISQQHLVRLGDLAQKVLTTGEPAPNLGRELFALSMNWFSLATFPLEWWIRYSQQPPTICFVVDPVSETTPTQIAPLPIVVRDMDIETTDLVKVGGPETRIIGTSGGGGPSTIPGQILSSQLIDNGTRLKVNLHLTTPEAPTPGTSVSGRRKDLAAGLYVGMVFAKAKGERQPLAIIFVLVQGDSTGKREGPPLTEPPSGPPPKTPSSPSPPIDLKR